MSPIVKSSLRGMAIGAVIGMIPGLFSSVVGNFVNLLQAAIYASNASSVVVYMGLLIGGAAGAVVGAMAETARR